MSFFVLAQAFILWMSLIVAVGPQNALIIKQGIRREALVPIVTTCILSEAIFIIAAVCGTGAFFERHPGLVPILMWGGIIYLLWFAFLSFRDAFRNQAIHVETTGSTGPHNASPVASRISTARAIKLALAITWLNPAMYVDSLVMLGGMTTHFPGEELSLAVGAFLGSLLWFAFLGFGASALSVPLSRPAVWRWINCAIGVVIVAVAFKLGVSAL